MSKQTAVETREIKINGSCGTTFDVVAEERVQDYIDEKKL